MSLIKSSSPKPIGYEIPHGSTTESAGTRLANKVLNLSITSNPFSVILPAVSALEPAKNFDELIRRSKHKSPLKPDMSSPVVSSFFEGIKSTPEDINEFCQSHNPPLSVQIFHGYSDMPDCVIEKIQHLDAAPEKPICYMFTVVGISDIQE